MNQNLKSINFASRLSQVLVHFETDFSRHSKGFSAKVSFTIKRHLNLNLIAKVYFQIPPASVGSDGMITSIPGTISSLDREGYYQNNLHTTTRIVAPRGSR